jgi:RNA polymerase sigma factor (sigma-70 family)
MKPEPKLAEQLRDGNEEALFSLMTVYYNDLYRYGLKLTADSNLTRDIIQQFIVHIWENRSKIMAAEHVEAYLLVSFKRFLIRELQKISSQNLYVLKASDDWEHPYEDYLIIEQEKELVRKKLDQAMECLSPRQKELLRLRYYDQMSFEQIALETSLSIRTVYNKLHEALKRLRSHEQLHHFHNQLYC